MRKKNGWGLSTMLILIGILILFGIVAIYYMSVMYSKFGL